MDRKYTLNREGRPMVFCDFTEQERRIARWIAAGLSIVVALVFGFYLGLWYAVTWWME